MKQQITRVSIAQTSKVAAILYACMGIFHFVIGVLMVLFGGETRAIGVLFLFMPLIMAIFGFLGIAFFSWVYNMIASKVGGVEFEFSEVE